MKSDIHPVYFETAQVVCACGNTFTTGSTKQMIRVELCSKCHPFYTGELKFTNIKGQVQKFQAKTKVAASMADQLAKKKAKKQNLPVEEKRPLTLREMLMQES